MLKHTVLLSMLVAFTQAGNANHPDDVGPTPEERLARAGVELSRSSLSEMLFDKSAKPEIRYLSAIALGRTGDMEVLPTLLSALEQPDADVRAGAAAGLRYLAAPESVAKLRSLALSDPAFPVRRAAVATLARIGDAAAVRALAEVARRHTEAEAVRINALLAIATVGDPAVRDPAREALLAPILHDRNRDIRAAGAIAWAATRGDEAVPNLVDVILDPATPEWLHEKAVRALEPLARKDFGYSGRLGARTESERASSLREITRWWAYNRSLYGR
jgi:HEAT repeat protein